MNEVYKEPANSYISFKNMIYIAMDKLSGGSIEKALEEARKSAIESD